MQRLVINKFNWWISNDPNLWWAGSLYNAEWVDVHDNSKFIKLAKANDEKLINTRSSWQIIGSLYESAINYLELSNDWYVSWLLNNETNDWYVTKEIWNWRNIWKIETSVGTYWFIIWNNALHQWELNSTKTNLWTYDTGTWINPDPEFDLWTWWTIWANWTISWWEAIHTSWSTAVLSRSMTSVIAQDYRLATKCDVTAWTCAVKVDWTTLATFSTSTNSTIPVKIYAAAWTSELLEFVPSTDFVWEISFCRVNEYDIIEYVETFNENAPYIIINNFIYIGNWNVITEIDTTLSTWVLSDVVSVDLSFTIKWITKIWDQIFIYATDGSSTRQYLWDWASTFVWRSITWIDKPIINVANFANYDYVITWWTNRQTLSIVNGYQLEPIIQTKDYVNNDARIYFSLPYTNSIETIGSQLLIPWYWWIYTYWSKKPWFDKALIKEFLNNWNSINSMFFREDLSHKLYAYANWIIDWVTWNYRFLYSLEEWWNEEYWVLDDQFTWWIELNPIFWQTYSNIKNFEKIISWVTLETDTQVNVYVKWWQYANVYIKWWPYTFAAWDTYTFWGRTYTVIDITESDWNDWYILHCSYSWSEITDNRDSWTFTRTAWSWPSTTYVNLVRYGYELIWQITDETDPKLLKAFDFRTSQYAVELISFDSDYTPRLYDLNLYYDEKDDN